MGKRQKPRVLVVEDEESIRDGLVDLLVFHGYRPEAVGTGEEGLRRALEGEFELVLLDVMLPGLSGFEVCRGLRAEKPFLPVLMLTAKGREEDVVQGLGSGADDYVTKPFGLRELIARVESLLRRSGRTARSAESLDIGSWSIDLANLRAVCGEETQELSAREADLLRVLVRERGRIVPRRALLQEVWGMRNVDEIETRTVDVHVAKLRKKLDTGEGSLIETVRGAGYRVAE